MGQGQNIIFLIDDGNNIKLFAKKDLSKNCNNCYGFKKQYIFGRLSASVFLESGLDFI